MWMEAIMAEVLFEHLPREAEEIHEKTQSE
jgi:hypothetical protein